jgi:hypothetical protein
MPGPNGGDSLVAANPTAVMPFALASLFRQERAIAIDQNIYADNTVQSSVLVSTSRKSWVLAFPLTADDKSAFDDFWEAVGAGAFKFYDAFETVPKFSYDITGASVSGRYAVMFDGAWQSVLQMGELACELSFRLIEVS